MNKRIAILSVVILAMAFGLPRLAAAGDGLTLSPVISRCVNADGDITCESKINANVKVSHGASATLVSQYIYQTATKDGQEGTTGLEDPITIKISKTLPTYRYPLRYLHTVPYQPHEEVRQVPNNSVGVSSCIDDPNAANPTCGWTLNASGNNIPDSQGFCSNRNLLDLKTCGDTPALWRGEELIGTASSLVNSYSTAHCLRQGTVFFAGYEIDTPQRNYEIYTQITNNTTLFSSWSLTPQQPIYLDRTGNHPVKAELLGEARPPVAAPDLSGYILYVPESPSSHPMVQEFWNNMLLVPRNMVTIDGSECNKVGTSFAAFRKQQGGASPTTIAGDCLSNQLYQLHQPDLTLLAGNPDAETRYLTTGMKMFKSAAALYDNSLQLMVGSPEMNYSTIALEMNNAQIGTATNEVAAWIKETYAAPFYSMSKQGTMKVTIQNTGTLPADYMVKLHDCNPGIVEPIPPQARTMDPGIFTFSFDIMSNVNMEGSHYCWVTLQSPQTARVYDEVQVFFDTHPYISEAAYQWQQQMKNQDSKKAD